MTAALRTEDGTSLVISDSRETLNRTGYGNTQGWSYGPGLLRPIDLIGTPTRPGLLWRMRYSHPVIRTILDQRRSIIKSTPMEWAGPHAQRLNAFWKEISHRTPALKLSNLLAHIIDQKTSFGFCLLEHAWSADSLTIWPVDPITVYAWQQDDQTAEYPSAIQFSNTMAGYQTLPFSRFYLFSSSIYPGNWWGDPLLSSLTTDFLAYEVEAKIYLGQRLLEKGIVHAKESGTTSTVESREVVISALDSLLRGQDVYLVTDGNWEVDVIQVSNGQDAVKQRVESNNAFDERIRQALASNLNTLGLSSVGSKALGETIKISDEEKLEAFLEEEFADFLASPLVADLANILEIPVNEIEIGTPGAKYSSDRVDPTTVWGLVKDGVLPWETLGRVNQNMLIESLGLDPSKMVWATPEAVVETVPALESETKTPPAEVRRAAAMALEDFMAQAPALRTQFTPRELVLVRRLAAGQPLSSATISQWEACLTREYAKTTPSKMRLEGFGGSHGQAFVSNAMEIT